MNLVDPMNLKRITLGIGLAVSGISIGFTPANAAGINLAGTWDGTGYTCGQGVLTEKVQVSTSPNSLVATKITGDDCVPAGNITFQGTLPTTPLIAGSSFPVTFTLGNPANPASTTTLSDLFVLNANEFLSDDVDFSREQNLFSDDTKAALTTVSNGFGLISFYLGTASLNPLIFPETGLASYFTGAVALGAGLLALDPPDSNFMTIAQPVTPTLSSQPFTAAQLRTQELANATNAIVDNLEQTVGLESALVTTANRLTGAYNAGAFNWANQQFQAGQSYEIQLGQLLAGESALWSAYKDAYIDAGLPALTLTASDFINYQDFLSNNGFSTSQQQILAELGFDSTTQSSIIQTLLAISPTNAASIENGNFLDILTDPSFNLDISNLAKELNPNNITLPIAVPEPNGKVLIDLGIPLLLGLLILKKRKVLIVK
jgi:hypothetical protein